MVLKGLEVMAQVPVEQPTQRVVDKAHQGTARGEKDRPPPFFPKFL